MRYKTPICNFIREYGEREPLRLHMPGHKGVGDIESKDITEIGGADVLYSPTGIIKESELIASELFGTGKTVYSTEGSSLAIRGMLFLAAMRHRKRHCGSCPPVIKQPRVVAGRNAHKTFLSAAAMLDLDVDFIYPETEGLVSCPITAAALEAKLSAAPETPAAVYVTSPDYLGNCLDIEALSAVCRKYEVPLLVDNAHGAYLRFLPCDRHPIALGADMCCDSAHKTLPVLTGGAYLHISKTAPKEFFLWAEVAMETFASTSPSYLTMCSLDKANEYLISGYKERLAGFADDVCALKAELTSAGYGVIGDEPLKLTLATKPYGYEGRDVALWLEKENMVAEFCDPDYITMMLTPELGAKALEKIKTALLSLPKKVPLLNAPPPLPRGERVLSVRDAVTAPFVVIPVEDALGCVLASASVSCPPAVPILTSGERIGEDAVVAFRYYGIETVRVVDGEY